MENLERVKAAFVGVADELAAGETNIEDIEARLIAMANNATFELEEYAGQVGQAEDALNQIPTDILTVFEINDYQGKLDEVQQLQDDLLDLVRPYVALVEVNTNLPEEGLTIPINIEQRNVTFQGDGPGGSSVGGAIVTPTPFVIPGLEDAIKIGPPQTPSGIRARGGTVGAGRSFVVGERGPEILQLGRTGGTIIPNSAIGGGGGGPMHVHVMLDGREIALAVVDDSQRGPGLPIKIRES